VTKVQRVTILQSVGQSHFASSGAHELAQMCNLQKVISEMYRVEQMSRGCQE
jgi:hypothetical protein